MTKTVTERGPVDPSRPPFTLTITFNDHGCPVIDEDFNGFNHVQWLTYMTRYVYEGVRDTIVPKLDILPEENAAHVRQHLEELEQALRYFGSPAETVLDMQRTIEASIAQLVDAIEATLTQPNEPDNG